MRASLSVFFALFRLGFRRTAAQWSSLLSESFFLLVLIYVYQSIYVVTNPAPLRAAGYDYVSMTWYVTLAEVSIFMTAHFYRETQQDIWENRLSQNLLRPTRLLTLRLWEWFGSATMRTVVFLPVGCLFAWGISGHFALSAASVPWVIAALFLGLWVGLCLNFCVGCATLWLGVSDSVYYLSQKLVFVLGGLILPLVFYPPWLQTLVWLTPFPSIVNLPADMAIDHNGAQSFRSLAWQTCWVLLGFVLTAWVERCVTRKILRDGE